MQHRDAGQIDTRDGLPRRRQDRIQLLVEVCKKLAQSNKVAPGSVRATADAFLQQRLTSSTTPREVDLRGYHGLYMEVTTPTELSTGRAMTQR